MWGLLAAVIMAGSFFLPWVEIFGQQIGPQLLIDNPNLPLSDLPWRAWAFLASFAFAALGAALALLQARAGLVMLIAGAIPYGLIAQVAVSAQDRVADLGLPNVPVDSGSPSEAMDMLMDVVALGLPAYFLSAAALIVIGLVRTLRGT